MEVYKDDIKDLLNIDNKEIKISDNHGIIEMQNLLKLKIHSPAQAINYIKCGNHFRHTAETLLNKESSRSHAIITIYIENKSLIENKLKKSVFHIVDLAGSERQKKAGTSGERIKEAGFINKGLLNLSIVVNQIIKNYKNIPYRDSKLTHILRDSLGGNAKTVIIATISQLDSNYEETIKTLEFAQRAKNVKNKAVLNEQLSEDDAKITEMKFKNLQDNYNSIFAKVAELENNQRNITLEKESISQEIEEMKKDILIKEKELEQLRKENEELKDKNGKNEIKIKIQDENNNSLKNQLIKLNNEKETISKEKIMLEEEFNKKRNKDLELIKY